MHCVELEIKGKENLKAIFEKAIKPIFGEDYLFLNGGEDTEEYGFVLEVTEVTFRRLDLALTNLNVECSLLFDDDEPAAESPAAAFGEALPF